MGNPLTIYALLRRHRNQGFCDDCIGKNTGIDRREVAAIASTLSLFPGEFTRSEAVCSQGCNSEEQFVTTAL